MDRRKFLSLSAATTGGFMVLPQFLHATANQVLTSSGNEQLIFIQLNGGNDGLNTYIPIDNPLYHEYRPNISFKRDGVINRDKGMAFHPALKGMAAMQQNGHLTVIQNVGYPEPIKSHFRSQEIWQTGSDSGDYLLTGWLGRYLDIQCQDINPVASLNIDRIDNLSLKGLEPNTITVRDIEQFKTNLSSENSKLSGQPALDFARMIAAGTQDGSTQIQAALKKAKKETSYPKTKLGGQLQWMSQLIKGNLQSKIYYTSQSGYDTHNNQVGIQERNLKELDDAVTALYTDLKNSSLLGNTTVVIFSEFGRRVKENGSGTDHGTAAPMFVIGGKNKSSVIGKNPDLSNLDNGDLIYEIDFRSVYASLLQDKLSFDPNQIGIKNQKLSGLF